MIPMWASGMLHVYRMYCFVQNIHLNFPRHSDTQVILPRNSSKAVKTSGDIMQYVVNMFPESDVHSVVQKGSSGKYHYQT